MRIFFVSLKVTSIFFGSSDTVLISYQKVKRIFQSRIIFDPSLVLLYFVFFLKQTLYNRQDLVTVSGRYCS